ncbi:MAG: Asp-tRNA(Asn)/Glu-tRNA(Gln) amidotransferase subunit GatC [Candidatus Levybacteria bacterium]|nr:Asp-tRNA(Asn)/Glu-tRNA(Gln) amidotransferase subunit GatC [Candidatus Levybacteria bacterium]
MKFDISHVAKLANLPLSEKEKTKFGKQLEETLEYIENLNEVDTSNIEPADNITGLQNISRKDTSSPSLSQDEALSNTKSKHNGMFKVKGILDNE